MENLIRQNQRRLPIALLVDLVRWLIKGYELRESHSILVKGKLSMPAPLERQSIPLLG